MKTWTVFVYPLAFSLTSLMLASCAPFSKQTPAEEESGYTYIPVDPFSVKTVSADSCDELSRHNRIVPNGADSVAFSSLLRSLPDNAVRMSIERFDTSGNITYGPGGIGVKGESYRVTVDYINADTTNIPLWISRSSQEYKRRETNVAKLFSFASEKYTPGSELYVVSRTKPEVESIDRYAEYNIPVYVGIGLRVTANVDIVKGNANISGLGAIGAESEAERLKGSLVVQTLGVNGKSIAAALPIQSELNRTTAQNAIVAVGSIKALLYEKDTVVSPRVVGIYLPFPGGKSLVNAIISELSKERIEWKRPCSFYNDKGEEL